jgi:anaphase-promoting complex subunit 8
MFQVKTLNELHNPSENELGLCDRLLSEELFPSSLWIMSLRACVLYHLHGPYRLIQQQWLLTRNCWFITIDFGRAEVQFERILALDPYRIDDIDVYSNILYVTDNKLKLSRLAHEFLALDKDRPEICCLVGVFCSGMHVAFAFSLIYSLKEITTLCARIMRKPSSISDGQHSSIVLISLLGR